MRRELTPPGTTFFGGLDLMQRDTLVFHTILAAARQRNGLNEARCRLVLEFLSAATAANSSLHRKLAGLELSELKTCPWVRARRRCISIFRAASSPPIRSPII